MKEPRPKLLRDSQVGIRNLREIKNLPVKELTDEEIVKLFAAKFDINSMVFIYQDKKGEKFCFGRLRLNKRAWEFQDVIKNQFVKFFGLAENWKEI
jgi:hypothetical protein